MLEKDRLKEVTPFLKSLTTEQKKSLVPHLKVLSKEYLELRAITRLGGTSYKQKAEGNQRKILSIAFFVCYSRKEFEKAWVGGEIFEKETLFPLLNWHCPSWFSDYINKQAEAEYVPFYFNYDMIMELMERGYLVPKKELIARVITQMIYETGKGNEWEFKPENLLKRKVTLEEHIWYVFEYESDINWSGRYLQLGAASSNKETTWISALRTYSSEGKIERDRLLKESLLATNRNFNKTLSGWFAELFIQLDPTQKEICQLQNELFATFNSAHSKPVNTALKFLKKITADKSFDVETFLGYAPLLLASETKGIVTSTLMIMDTLAKKRENCREEICIQSCQALLHPDDALQSRAAKLIQNYGKASSENLKDALKPYEENLFVNARDLLQDFMPVLKREASIGDEPNELVESSPVVVQENKIGVAESFDDLLFLMSQALDNNEVYHFDLLPAALINLQDEVKGENIAKLEPAFQRAYKLLMNDWTSNSGFLDNMLATFLIDYGRYLTKEYPDEALVIRVLHEKYTQKDKENKSSWSFYVERIGTLQEWRTQTGGLYEPGKMLLLAALEKLQSKNRFPLLSTPTYFPAWVSATVLVERLSMYQTAGVKPQDMDLQVAISRCRLEDAKEAQDLAYKLLTGEYLNLMKFLLEGADPEGPFELESAWINASLSQGRSVHEEFENFSSNNLTQNYLTGQLSWKSVVEEFSYDRYDYSKKKNVKVRDKRKVLRIANEERKQKENTLTGLFSRLRPSKKQGGSLIYEYLLIKPTYLSAEYNDIRRLLMLIPNNPEPLLAQVIQKSLHYPNFWEEGDRRMVTATLETLLEIWNGFGKMAHLFVATCMISSDKTVRAFAAEIWIKGVREGTINSALLGEVIGIHETVEFAPLKRFTDLVLSNMFQVSDLHNTALEELLTALMIQLPVVPVKNLKKLLEIYQELLFLVGLDLKQELIPLLEGWKASASLKKLVVALEGRIPVGGRINQS